MKQIAVLVSGGGTNLQAILESERRGENPNGRVSLVVASKPGVYALTRAENFGVDTAVVARRDYADSAAFDAALLAVLQAHRIDVVVLAGFLSVLGPSVIAAYPNRILNVHPSLIPSFCGPGFYGLRVHEAALARGGPSADPAPCTSLGRGHGQGAWPHGKGAGLMGGGVA